MSALILGQLYAHHRPPHGTPADCPYHHSAAIPVAHPEMPGPQWTERASGLLTAVSEPMHDLALAAAATIGQTLGASALASCDDATMNSVYQLLQQSMPAWGAGGAANQTVTPLHSTCLALALLTRSTTLVRQVLIEAVADFSPSSQGQTVKSAISYLYYAGLGYAGLQDCESALRFWACTLAFPARAISQVVIAAYKHYVLMYVRLHGKCPSLPDYVSPIVTGALAGYVSEYQTLAQAIADGDTILATTTLQEHAQLWRTDGTATAAAAAIQAIPCHKLRRAASVYSRAPLARMSQVAQMTEEEVLAAIPLVNALPGAQVQLELLPDNSVRVTSTYDVPEAERASALAEQLQRITGLQSRLQALHDALRASPAVAGYIAHAHSAAR